MGHLPFTKADACWRALALLLVAQDFLNAGPPPIYIGFGSLVVDNPVQLTRRFIKALQ